MCDIPNNAGLNSFLIKYITAPRSGFSFLNVSPPNTAIHARPFLNKNIDLLDVLRKCDFALSKNYLNPKLVSNSRTDASTFCISSYCFLGPLPMKRYTWSVLSFDISFFKSVKSCTVDILLDNLKLWKTFLMCICNV